jgi:hypothetical protein
MKKTQSSREAQYGVLKRKTFTAAFAAELQRQVPPLGILTADRLARHFEQMFNEYFPPTDRLRMGQLMWPAVAKEETAGYGKRIENTKLKPVMLDAITHDDINEFLNGTKKTLIRRKMAVRLFDQAFAQGGVLTCVDVAAILGLSPATISRYVRLVESEQGRVIPRRGTVHDIGPSVTHKRQICYRVVVLGRSIELTARETNHSPEAVTRYVQDYRRVHHCFKAGFSLEETAFATKLSKSLVNQYADLETSFSPSKTPTEPVE